MKGLKNEDGKGTPLIFWAMWIQR